MFKLSLLILNLKSFKMKNKTTSIFLIGFGLLLNISTIFAQTGSEIKFKSLSEPSNSPKDLVSVSTVINTKQPLSGNGIHFTLVVKNNSGLAITTKNIVDRLTIGLYDERGLDISVPNEALKAINRRAEDRQWRFRTESVVPDRVYTNGSIEKSDFKKLEYIQIPAGGEWKINLILKNVKQVETPKDELAKLLKPTKSLSAGNYKLKIFLSIVSKEQNQSGRVNATYESPMIDIQYGN